jgi:hypothetical protein
LELDMFGIKILKIIKHFIINFKTLSKDWNILKKRSDLIFDMDEKDVLNLPFRKFTSYNKKTTESEKIEVFLNRSIKEEKQKYSIFPFLFL